eukprot:TRINITY_DN5086_c0_g1_i6.p1 TRINITY_DN5086_c0_g1~~TRINITY_DN5086_c0_g1_i6.p1  ORF type:complete len:350 (+),score=79.64 TRINITY_DN5086_c0_g1_i6:53-1102(+)
MAQYEIAGRADDMSFAQVELLCDHLCENLPFFTVKKRTVHPTEWDSVLKEICADLGLNHRDSHIIWTPEGRYVGTVTAFLTEIQRKYNINWRVPIDLLSGVASENMTGASHDAQQKKKAEKDKAMADAFLQRQKRLEVLDGAYTVVNRELSFVTAMQNAAAKNSITLKALQKAANPSRGVLRSASKSSTSELHSVKFREEQMEEELTRPKTPQGTLVKFRHTIHHIASNLEEIDAQNLCDYRSEWSSELSRQMVSLDDTDKLTKTLSKHMASLEFYTNFEMLARIVEMKRRQLLGCTSLDKPDIIILIDDYAKFFASIEAMIEERFATSDACKSDIVNMLDQRNSHSEA